MPVVAKSVKWQKAHPDELAVKSARIRARKADVAQSDLSLEQWLEIKTRQAGICAMCEQPRKLTLDHIHPLSRGGPNTASNIQGLCKRCNSKKSLTTDKSCPDLRLTA